MFKRTENLAQGFLTSHKWQRKCLIIFFVIEKRLKFCNEYGTVAAPLEQQETSLAANKNLAITCGGKRKRMEWNRFKLAFEILMKCDVRQHTNTYSHTDAGCAIFLSHLFCSSCLKENTFLFIYYVCVFTSFAAVHSRSNSIAAKLLFLISFVFSVPQLWNWNFADHRFQSPTFSSEHKW